MADGLSRARLARQARHLRWARGGGKPHRAFSGGGLLVLMTDDARMPDPLAAARVLPRGSLVIARARDPARRQALVEELLALARARGLVLLVADDPGLAVRADGLHLPEARAHQAAYWRARMAGPIVTAAAHTLRAALRAAGHADAVLLSPVFPTGSHGGVPGLGAARARLIARALPVPAIALGGVAAGNAAMLSGFGGLAAITALRS